jgi:hypothetical protein
MHLSGFVGLRWAPWVALGRAHLLETTPGQAARVRWLQRPSALRLIPWDGAL